MKKVVVPGLALALIGGAIALIWGRKGQGEKEQRIVEATQGSFLVSITEEGTFAAKDNLFIRAELTAYKDQMTILKIVEKGSAVKKGDVLVEFDRSDIEQKIRKAEVEVQSAKSAVVQAEEDIKVQNLQNALDLEKVDHDVRVAEKNLKKFSELEGPKAVREAEVAIVDAENEMKEAEKNLQQVEALAKEDLASQSEVERARVAVEKAKNKFEFSRQALLLKRDYEQPLQRWNLEYALRSATTFRDGKKSAIGSITAQKEAKVQEVKVALLEKEGFLEKLRKDVECFTLTSPVDSIALYGEVRRWYWGGNEELKPGGRVQARSTLFTLPDLSALKIALDVHEGDVNKVKAGLEAEIRPEAFSDLVLRGQVKKVGEVTSNQDYWNEDSKGKYEVELELLTTDSRLKPGMKAKVEIKVEEVKDVVYVPVEAVFDREGKTVCYVSASEPRFREVKTGRSNADYVEITEGLSRGEHVLLYDPARP